MPFDRPTLTQLRQNVAADIDAALPGAQTLLRYSNLRILAQVLAGALNGQYGYLDWIALQAVPYTATGEALEAWAALKGVTRKASAAATGAAGFTGTPTAVLPAGSQFVRDDGRVYATTAEATVDGSGALTVAAQAVMDLGEPEGSAWNADAGLTVTLISAVSGVNSSGAVSTAFTGGTDIETDDELRARMLKVYADPPQGGAKADYEEWALQVAGVTRAWAYPLEMGTGTVLVRFMMDDVQAAHDGFPQGTNGVAAGETRDTAATGDQLAVADAIFPLQPVTALVYLAAPSANTVDFTIAGLSAASASVKAAIAAAITAVFLDAGKPGGTIEVSRLETAIGAVAGSLGFILTGISPDHGSVTPGSAGDLASDLGYLPVLGAITWA
ncbi:baseplate J/gp47 family protein [Phenylobacterium sp.]|uniref:baseplate J/gp47 family protein n=1 Tax=Phenylobacterium sp. TaxID=1871053 RepID=UPI0035AEA462